MTVLDEHYSGSARRFLQTAIVIDDQAQFGPTLTTVVPMLPTPSSSIINRVDAPQQPAVAVTVEQGSQTGALNAKVLSHAFISKDMICGLYRPEAGEEMVERTVGAARLADVVVVDWYLETGNSGPAKEIVKQLLREDRSEHGRLRLIAIYTSQAGRLAIAGELLAEIKTDPDLAEALKQDGPALVGAAARIIILNKRGTPPNADLDEVSEEGLPERLIGEFARLAPGLLSSFALSSVAAVRRGVHHVLALYTEELDGAFVAHRAGLKHPEDASLFAVDMLTSELRNLVEIDDEAESTLDAEVVEAWIVAKDEAGHRFRSDHAEFKVADVRNFASGGLPAVQDAKQYTHADPEREVSQNRRLGAARISRIFYKDADAARAGVRALARLTTFQREPGRTRITSDWRPTLTLGSLIQAVPAEGAALGTILLCVQPRCDANRLSTRTAFPMQIVHAPGESFNLVFRDRNGFLQEGWVSLKPMHTKILEFEPHKAKQVVLANETFDFTDTDGGTWRWLGDLKEMAAQRWAADLGSRIVGVGIDELELIRLAADGKVKPPWP